MGRKRQDDSQDVVVRIQRGAGFNPALGVSCPAAEICGHRPKQPSFPTITFTSLKHMQEAPG